MNPQKPTDEYLLLIRGTHWSRSLSPAELQKVVTDFYEWVDALGNNGVNRGAQPLLEAGKIITGAGGAKVVDGVFAESKEAVAGYFRLGVASQEEALKIARACPLLDYGAQLELRPVAETCRPVAELRALANA